MRFQDFRQNLVEAAKVKTPSSAQSQSNDFANKVRTAKNVLGLKNLNVAAVVAANNIANKFAKLPYNQLLNRLPLSLRQHYVDFQSAVPSDIMNAPTAMYAGALQKLKTSRPKPMKESCELEEDSDDLLVETIDPPMMLILKRKGVRLFPDGKRAALYVNDKTGLTFMLPYDANGLVQSISGVQEEIELVSLEEASNVQKMGRTKIVRARVRGGKVQRRKKVSAVKGYTIRGGKLTRMPSSERIKRKISQRKAKIKRKAKAARALIKRKRSLRKRKALGL
jgi:hypothetical protein